MGETSPLLIDEIRSRSRKDIDALLAFFGFQRGSGSWVDADLAESLLFQGPIPDGGVYHRQLGWIADFIGIGFDHA